MKLNVSETDLCGENRPAGRFSLLFYRRCSAVVVILAIVTPLAAGCAKQERPPAGAAPVWNPKNK